eukprot:COSAG02_NODE_856_length_16468_cov_131.787831_13_plen_748_part_00
MMRAGVGAHALLLLAQLLLAQLPQSHAEATCDWSLLGRMLEAVSDTCCFDAAGPNDPPLGNTARLRQHFHEHFSFAEHGYAYSYTGGDNPLSYCEAKGGQACAEYYALATMRGPSTERYGVPAQNQCRITSLPGDCSTLGPGEPLEGCGHLYPACTKCAASCEASAFQQCLETCDLIYNYVQPDASSLATVINDVCASAVVDCQGTCLQGFADSVLHPELRRAPTCGEGGPEPCMPPETAAWKATVEANPDLRNEVDRCFDLDELDEDIWRRPTAPPGCNCEADPNPAVEQLCTRTSCDAACATVLQPLMDTCRPELDVLFDANDGIADGVAGTFTTLYETCPTPQPESTSRRSKLTQAACTEFAQSGTVDGVVPASPLQVCDEDGYVCVDAIDNMVSIATSYALGGSSVLLSTQPWLQMCEPNGVYEACGQIYDEIQNVAVAGASNLNWKEAVLPSGASWSESLTSWSSVLKCSSFGTAQTYDGSSACPAEDSTWPTAASDSSADGPMLATNEDGTGWADLIANYASKRPPAFRAQLARCEEALASRTGSGVYCPSEVPVPDVGTFVADCGACMGWAPAGFSFTSGESSSACLSYFVGYMEYFSSSFGGSPGIPARDACLAQFRCHGTCEDHAAFLVSTAFDQNSAFCDYTPSSSVTYYARGQPPPTGFGGEVVAAGCETNPCAAGESCSFDGSSTTCRPCPEYTYSTDGVVCGLCQPGQAPNADKSGCETCREGSYSEFGVVCRI